MKILRVSLIGLLIACISLLSGCNRCSETKSAPHGVGTYEKGPNLSSDNDGKLVAHFIKADDSLFERPNVSNGPWQRIVPKTISLFPQNITQPSKPETTVKSVDVRIVHNGKWLGVMLSWDSSSPQTMTTTGRFSDAAAASFPVGDPSATSPFMGGPGAGVEIIYWKSLWQHDIENGYQDVTAEFPNITADAYYGYKQNPYDSNPASKVPVTEVLKSNEAKEGLPAIAL
ncbi:MAG: hypothetical protein QF704_15505, partial [Anaerolineales bacterium]|nr:hypothetical protein [Anaerolineales bacterium]